MGCKYVRRLFVKQRLLLFGGIALLLVVHIHRIYLRDLKKL